MLVNSSNSCYKCFAKSFNTISVMFSRFIRNKFSTIIAFTGTFAVCVYYVIHIISPIQWHYCHLCYNCKAGGKLNGSPTGINHYLNCFIIYSCVVYCSCLILILSYLVPNIDDAVFVGHSTTVSCAVFSIFNKL